LIINRIVFKQKLKPDDNFELYDKSQFFVKS